jgi:hypothetical protein
MICRIELDKKFSARDLILKLATRLNAPQYSQLYSTNLIGVLAGRYVGRHQPCSGGPNGRSQSLEQI